ncbi:MAG: ABC transporter substrate-binding protein [Pseudomonadota bacterium]
MIARPAKRLFSKWAIVFVLAFSLSGCDNLTPSTLRIAVNAWPGYGYFAIAKEQGFLSGPEAPALEIVETASLGDSIRAFNRGQVHMLGGTLAELASINLAGKRSARAILVLNRSVGGDMIVSTSDITQLRQLEGKRLALEPVSANVLVLAAALSESGLDLDQVELMPLPQGEMPAALAEQRVDAAITYPPVSLELLALPGTHRLFDTRQSPNAVIDVLIVAEDVIEKRPDGLRKIVAAHNQALVWGRENPIEARQLLAKHTGLSVEAMAEVEKSIDMVTLEQQAGVWQSGACLERFLPRAIGILQRLNDYPVALKNNATSMLEERFVLEAVKP